jgi:hypothetical protein
MRLGNRGLCFCLPPDLILYSGPAHSTAAQARVGVGARCGERARWLRPETPWDGVSFLVVLVVFLLQSV